MRPSRGQLLLAFLLRTPITVCDTHGVISSLEHEDGSGMSFNVTFTGGRTVYVRCRS